MRHRHELSDEEWVRIAPLLPPERGRRGRPSKDNRRMVNAMLWIGRTGAPWRDLPRRYGRWSSVYTRFNRWSKQGVWNRLMDELKGGADPEVNMIDSSVVRAHQHAAGGKGGPRSRL